jgi:hypothetical protein
LEVECPGKFESIFETALNNKSDDLLGTFGEITLDKKSHATVPLKDVSAGRFELFISPASSN